MRRTKSQVRAEEIARLHAEQFAYEQSVQGAIKVASYARCAAIEELYEMFDVKPEQKAREGRNGPVQVSIDKDESIRTARLVEAVARLAAERDILKATAEMPPAFPSRREQESRGAHEGELQMS